MTSAPLLLAAGCAVLAGLGGAGVPALLRRVPSPDPTTLGLPEGEAPPPTYAEVAGRPGLALRCAVLAAAVAAVLALAVGARPVLVGLVAVTPVAVGLAVVDLRTRLLPRLLVLPATAVLVLVPAVAALLGGAEDVAAALRAVLGLVVARSVYWLLWLVRSAGLGFGDVRLAGMVGAGLGPLGWAEVGVGLYAGFLVFGVPGALLALVRRDRALLRTAYPFGPFLLVGALVGVLVGAPVVGALGWG